MLPGGALETSKEFLAQPGLADPELAFDDDNRAGALEDSVPRGVRPRVLPDRG
jgi:hypothetical protein